MSDIRTAEKTGKTRASFISRKHPASTAPLAIIYGSASRGRNGKKPRGVICDRWFNVHAVYPLLPLAEAAEIQESNEKQKPSRRLPMMNFRPGCGSNKRNMVVTRVPKRGRDGRADPESPTQAASSRSGPETSLEATRREND